MADTGQPDKAPETTAQPSAETKPAEETKPVEGKKTETEPKTALADPGEPAGPGPADWPDDWAEKIAGDDEKELARLKRLGSVKGVYDAYRNMEKKFKRGEDADPFPGDGTDEEKAAWRENHKVPKEASKYIEDWTLDEGLVIGDDDKPLVNDYLKSAHESNLPTEVVRDNLNWYFSMRDKQAQERAIKDEEAKIAARDELRDEMGKDFQRNLSAAYGLLNDLGGDDLLAARLPDGTRLGDNARWIRGLAKLALEINPAATITPNTGAGAMASLAARKAEIENIMKTDRDAYWRNTTMQAEYRQILEAEEKMAKRSAA